jgi:hypothetical protein
MNGMLCAGCGATLVETAKFCGVCGAMVMASECQDVNADRNEDLDSSVDLSDADRDFIEIAMAVFDDSIDPDEAKAILLDNAADLHISNARALHLISMVSGSLDRETAVPVKLEYDAAMAVSGSAKGNTLLVLKVENRQSKLIKNLNVYFKHPESREVVEFPALTTLVKGIPKHTESPIVLDRVGYHSMREGFIKITTITGAEQFLKVSGVVRLSAENSDASRANINSYSSTIQTHGGGVIDASGNSGRQFLDFNKGQASDNGMAWVAINLALSRAEDFETFIGMTEIVQPPEPIQIPVKEMPLHGVAETPEITKLDNLKPAAIAIAISSEAEDDYPISDSAPDAIHQEMQEMTVEPIIIDNFQEKFDAVHAFFLAYSFVSQRCQESTDRSVHVVQSGSSGGGNISEDLLTRIADLLPGSPVIAICEDDNSSLDEENSVLSTWVGLASVITADGVYHVRSFPGGDILFDGELNFLSWYRFFTQINGGLVVRDNVPDIWLGTKDHELIKGSYVNYSTDIDAWIYYHNFIRKDFIDKFTSFKYVVLGI